jgi:hypothetical protein
MSTTGNISFGIAFVAGRNRVPSPATGKTALRTRFRLGVMSSLWTVVVRNQLLVTAFGSIVEIFYYFWPNGENRDRSAVRKCHARFFSVKVR